MRVSRDVMAKRHDQILSQTSKMLRRRGILGTNLADLMSAAGLTHGGFYKHFDSKDVLVAEATARIFDEINQRFEARIEADGVESALRAYVTDYLSTAHIENPELGCPLSSFGPDVSRVEGPVRSVFTDGISRTLDLVMLGFSGPPALRRERAIDLLSALVGAVSMARAVQDEAIHNDILDTARRRANRTIEDAAIDAANVASNHHMHIG